MIKGLLKFLNVLTLLVLMVSCLACYVDPNTFWQLSFVGFLFPVVLLVNIFFLLFWVVLWNRFAWVPLVGIVLAWAFVKPSIAFNFFDKQKEQGMKVLTWNVKNFDLYTWSHNIETRQKMMDMLEHENPDVLCLQEFYSNNQYFKNLEYLRDTLGYKYAYFPPALELTKTPKTKLQTTLWKKGLLVQKWGVATFSKYPLVDTGVVDFSNAITNHCIYTDVLYNNERVRVYNVHFQSIHLGYKDYATLDEIEQKQQTTWADVKGIMRKMKQAYTKRAVQAKAVNESMAQYEGKKILCGDFNDVPVSYTYKTVKADLIDAFEEKGKGFEPTFVKRFSIFRIDYVLFDKSLRVNSYRTLKEAYSDHYPVCVTFSL